MLVNRKCGPKCATSASCGTDGERRGESGVRLPKKRAPTQVEVDEHNVAHLPCRSWCTHCVHGRGEAHPHHESGDEERDVPELHMDYCFMGKVDEKAQPILVVKERDKRMMCSMLVGEEGGVDEHVVKRITAFIEELGHESAKIVLKSDQESSVRSVIDPVIRARKDAPSMPEYFPVRFSRSNGIIERDQGGTRTTEGPEERPGLESKSGAPRTCSHGC